MAKKTKAEVWLEGLNSLRLTVKEAIEMIHTDPHIAEAILQASYDETNPILLEQNCGCGK
jgi:hypothetical protein